MHNHDHEEEDGMFFLPEVGETVPAMLEFDTFHKNAIVPMSFADLRGKWTILVFYPADFTFVCPTELEDLQALYADFVKEGAEVLSMSTDTVFAHKAWKDCSPTIKTLEYPMGADPSHELSEMFGVLMEGKGLANRGTFIIDPEGVIKSVEVVHDSIGRSAKETLRKLRAAKFTLANPGNVCPANFETGSETLKPSIDLAGTI